MKNNLGATFIELLVAIAILIILAATSVSVLHFFQKSSDLNNSVDQIINVLRFAQNRTLASEGPDQYGVYFNDTVSPHRYILFKGSNYSSRDTSFNDEIHTLPDTIEMNNIDLNGGKEVVFIRITGLTNRAGNISVRLKTDLTQSKTIYIESSGQVGLNPPLTPTNGRLVDSRHTHFNLGWSIQNATFLKFYFPNASQTETVDMADYFTSTKTEFDWEGTFSISSTDQTFRVHTHLLDAFDTLLCIHRDRNNGINNQEVIIYIVDGGIDKDVAHYLADSADTVEKGFYVNTMERQ